MFFSWIFPVFRIARKPDFDTSDLYKPLKVHKSNILGDKLCQAWDDEVAAKKAQNQKPSLLRATLRVFGLEFLMLGLALFALEIFLRYDEKQLMPWHLVNHFDNVSILFQQSSTTPIPWVFGRDIFKRQLGRIIGKLIKYNS